MHGTPFGLYLSMKLACQANSYPRPILVESHRFPRRASRILQGARRTVALTSTPGSTDQPARLRAAPTFAREEGQ